MKNYSGKSLGNLKIKFSNRDLDYGLYWYGKYGVCEKYIPGLENAFYDISKKTVVFAHGWQANSVPGNDAYGRIGFRYEMYFWEEDNFGGAKDQNGLKQFTNHSWIDKGKNFWLTEYCRTILYTIMNQQWSNGIVVERYNSTILNLYLPYHG